ncbi:MAG TPA: uroporphyrinogen-III decarboxylase [Clostridiales bacterium]|nr:uroporphyrinogen-III decarboxylase [Clostridiales bacterium]
MELMQNEMTPRERLTAYARGEEVDRIPTTLSAGETIPFLYGISIREYYFSADLMIEVESRMAKDFGADNMGMGLGLRTLAEAIGTKLHYTDDNVSFITEPIIKDYSQLSNMSTVNINKDGRLPILIEAFSRLQERFGKERIISSGMAGPLTTACALVGADKFLKDIIKRPDEVRLLMEYSTACVINCARDLNAKLGISLSLSEPIASGNLISRKMFERWLVPYLKEIVDAFKTFQNAPSLHICGKTKDRWEDLLTCGISGFWADNCESLQEIKAFMGDQVSISGNVTPVEILRNGTISEIDEAVRICILEGSDSPMGYLLCPGCTTPVGTPKENMIAFMNAASKYGRSAKKGYPCRYAEKNIR